jgi:hypothetical protein
MLALKRKEVGFVRKSFSYPYLIIHTITAIPIFYMHTLMRHVIMESNEMMLVICVRNRVEWIIWYFGSIVIARAKTFALKLLKTVINNSTVGLYVGHIPII